MAEKIEKPNPQRGRKPQVIFRQFPILPLMTFTKLHVLAEG